VDELEELLGVNLEPPRAAPNLGPRCWQLLGAVMRRPHSREGLHAAVYGALPEADQPDVAMVSTCVSRLNKFLRPLGAEIEGRRGYGRYWMSDASKTAYKKFIEADHALADVSRGPELAVRVPGGLDVPYGAVALGLVHRADGRSGHAAPREAAPRGCAQPLRDGGPGRQGLAP
jgi:hypothetical protein